MKNRVDPDLHRDFSKFGNIDVSTCMNCGNCTATCSLADETASFPRRDIHYLQVGLRDKLLQSADPWLCYYCGDCSESCPRDANPGEIMMAARRYLTSQYDWTGLAKRMYVSKAWEIGAIAFVGLIVAALFYFLHGPMVTGHVELNTFAPVEWVEFGDLIMAAILSVFLLSNAYRMLRFIMSGEQGLRLPISLYIKELPTIVTHFATQRRWRQCSADHSHWLRHFLLVSGYVTMLTLILVFLRWFQTDIVHPIWHPTRLLGYYATGVLLYATVAMMISRIKKSGEIHKFTEPSDWGFLILLFLTSLTGIAVHLFRIADWPLLTYYTYVIHLVIAVPMLIVEVPFGKWAHLLYRPLAVYLTNVKEKAKALPVKEEVKVAITA